MDLAKSTSSERGFTLVETLVAIGILTAVSIGVAQLFGIAAMANMSAKGRTSSSMLAVQRMEQLRGLTWGYDNSSGLTLPISDMTTDLSTNQPTAGGQGLNPSPTGTLDGNVPGYVDYLDAQGNWVGNGAGPAPGTSFIRRWAIEPLPIDPNNTFVLQVRVIPFRREARRTLQSGQNTGRMLDESRLVTVKTRKAPCDSCDP